MPITRPHAVEDRALEPGGRVVVVPHEHRAPRSQTPCEHPARYGGGAQNARSPRLEIAPTRQLAQGLVRRDELGHVRAQLRSDSA